MLFNHRAVSATFAPCFRAALPCAGTILARWGLARSSPPEAVASSCASCPARISRRGNFRSWLWGRSAQVLRSCRDARGARTGRGAPAEDSDRKAPNDQGRKHSRGRPRTSLVRLVREKTRQASEKDKESQARNVSNSNKTSNGNKQANCRKQMGKPRPAPILVFDVFSPARS